MDSMVKEILELRKENLHLRKVEILYRSLLMELHARDIIPGSKLTSLCDPNGDVVSILNNRIEIKYSSDSGEGKYTKWDWSKILGKEYEYLLLIGQYVGGFKYFIFRYDNLPMDIINSNNRRGKISIRYSERVESMYQKYLAPNEATSVQFEKI